MGCFLQSPSPRWITLLLLLVLVPGAAAFSVSPATVDPAVLSPGDTVNVSAQVYVTSGTSFTVLDDLQFVTVLDDPVWIYTVVVDDIENTRPADRGKILTIGGYELSYPASNNVDVRITLNGRVPSGTPEGTDLPLVTVQELDSRGRSITSSVTTIKHLVGQPTPTPTPSYGQIGVSSEPAGANVYLDNTLWGISPMTIKAVSNGRHTVTLRLEGYEDFARDVTVAGDAPQVNAVLVAGTAVTGTPQGTGPATTTVPGTPATIQATPATGSLSVTTSPPGALVYIDGQMKGVSPATIPGLSPGTHTIRLILDGYQDLETTTEITAGSTAEFVTGLPQRKQAPGFSAVPALAALGLLIALPVFRPGRKP